MIGWINSVKQYKKFGLFFTCPSVDAAFFASRTKREIVPFLRSLDKAMAFFFLFGALPSNEDALLHRNYFTTENFSSRSKQSGRNK
jgi:hypothetical protein